MNFWQSKDKRKYLDLDAVVFWDYSPKEAIIEELGKCDSNLKEILKPESWLQVVVGGYMLSFSNEEADEIYNLLNSNKKLLNG